MYVCIIICYTIPYASLCEAALPTDVARLARRLALWGSNNNNNKNNKKTHIPLILSSLLSSSFSLS